MAPQSKAEALRSAALRMLKSKDRRHPFYWAAFVLIGDGN
jgi:CHAT domain-containing protein